MNLYFYVVKLHVFTTLEMDTLCYFKHCAICVLFYNFHLHLVSVYMYMKLCCVSGSQVQFDYKRDGTHQPKLLAQFSSGSKGNKEVKYCYIQMALASLNSEIRVLVSLYKRKSLKQRKQINDTGIQSPKFRKLKSVRISHL